MILTVVCFLLLCEINSHSPGLGLGRLEKTKSAVGSGWAHGIPRSRSSSKWGPSATAAPGNMGEMHILWLHQKIWGWGLAICVSTSPLGDFNAAKVWESLVYFYPSEMQKIFIAKSMGLAPNYLALNFSCCATSLCLNFPIHEVRMIIVPVTRI